MVKLSTLAPEYDRSREAFRRALKKLNVPMRFIGRGWEVDPAVVEKVWKGQ
jgi:ribosomal protein L16/L10AE